MTPWSPSPALLALQEEHARLDAAVRELNLRQANDYCAGHHAQARAVSPKLHELRGRRWRAREALLELFKREAMGDDVP